MGVQEQGDAVWKVRDKLQAELSTQELKQLLEANGQTIPSGESKVHQHTHHTSHTSPAHTSRITSYIMSLSSAAGCLC